MPETEHPSDNCTTINHEANNGDLEGKPERIEEVVKPPPSKITLRVQPNSKTKY